MRHIPLITALALLAPASLASDFTITPVAIEGAGWSFLPAGELTLSGTVGRHDASPAVPTLSGGFTITAGFWAPEPCPGQGSLACGPGDWNEDGVIDFNDLLAFLNDYNAQTDCSDTNADGAVDFNDLLEFLNRYNTPC